MEKEDGEAVWTLDSGAVIVWPTAKSKQSNLAGPRARVWLKVDRYSGFPADLVSFPTRFLARVQLGHVQAPGQIPAPRPKLHLFSSVLFLVSARRSTLTANSSCHLCLKGPLANPPFVTQLCSLFSSIFSCLHRLQATPQLSILVHTRLVVYVLYRKSPSFKMKATFATLALAGFAAAQNLQGVDPCVVC